MSSAALALTDYLQAAKPGLVIPKLPSEEINAMVVLPCPPIALVAATNLAGILMVLEQETEEIVGWILDDFKSILY